MGYGYVRANYGDRCFYNDSSFKRYNRAHGDTTIFNFNYGASNNCCGGHGTGFWGGLGMSIGYNLGSWLMGGLNTLGGWLGMGNFGGFGNIGGWGLNGLYGGGSTYNNTNNTTNNTTSSKSRKTDKTDKEYEKINDAREELQKLQDKKEPVTADEIKALEDKINSLTAKDNVNDADNQTQIDMLKHDFDKLKTANPNPVKPAAADNKDGKPADGTTGTPVVTGNGNTGKAAETALGKLPQEKQTALEGTNIPKEKLNELLQAGLSPDEIIGLNTQTVTPEEMKTLKTLDVEYKDGVLTCPTELNTENLTKLAEISNSRKIPVAMGYNSNSAVVDHWIKGYIDKDSIKTENNKLSYSIDCKDVEGAKFGNKYKVEQQENNSYIISVQVRRNGVYKGAKVYTWNPTEKRLERDGEAIVTESQSTT